VSDYDEYNDFPTEKQLENWREADDYRHEADDPDTGLYSDEEEEEEEDMEDRLERQAASYRENMAISNMDPADRDYMESRRFNADGTEVPDQQLEYAVRKMAEADGYVCCLGCGDYYKADELNEWAMCATCDEQSQDYSIDYEAECPDCGYFPLSPDGSCRKCRQRINERGY
jgi:hypothetical protein